MTLSSSNTVLAAATNNFDLEIHISWEPLVSGLQPNARGTAIIRSAGTNWNKSYDGLKCLEIAFNYSDSKAVRVREKAHDPVNSSDLIAFMLPNKKGNNVKSPDLIIEMEDLVAHNRDPVFTSLRPSTDACSWGRDQMNRMKTLLKKDLFLPSVKLEAAKEMRFLNGIFKRMV